MHTCSPLLGLSNMHASLHCQLREPSQYSCQDLQDWSSDTYVRQWIGSKAPETGGKTWWTWDRIQQEEAVLHDALLCKMEGQQRQNKYESNFYSNREGIENYLHMYLVKICEGKQFHSKAHTLGKHACPQQLIVVPFHFDVLKFNNYIDS